MDIKLVDYVFKNNDPKFKFIMDDIEFVKKNYNIDSYSDYVNKIYYYFKYDINYIQPWAPKTSTETRIIINENNIDNFISHDYIKHENKMFFHKFIRQFCFFNTFYKNLVNIKELHYDGCYDCCREIMIIINYIQNKKQDKSKENSTIPVGDRNISINLNYDIKNISKTLTDKKVIKKLINIYKKISKYTYFDLSENNKKCRFHNMKKQIIYFNIKCDKNNK
jgi:hypothetical protein